MEVRHRPTSNQSSQASYGSRSPRDVITISKIWFSQCNAVVVSNNIMKTKPSLQEMGIQPAGAHVGLGGRISLDGTHGRDKRHILRRRPHLAG